jgi:pimeloyl-ACP methyl ester carboxylesterase
MRPRSATIAGLAALALAGCGADDRAARMPAHLHARIDIAGAGMYVDCRGRGSPPVVLDAGLGVDASTTWARVQPAVARFTRVCWYDRAGMGRSDPRSGPRTSATMVRELRELLGRARVASPIVLAGASLGGLNAQLFAAQHPEDVAGMVLIDAIHPDLDRRIAPLLGPSGEAARESALARNGEGVSFGDLLVSDDQVRRAGVLPSVRLVALRHGVSFDPGSKPDPQVERLWTALQRDLAARSPFGRYVRVPGSHHRIAEDRPEAVVDAIREVVGAAR